MSNTALKSNNSVESNLAGLEIVSGSNKLPKRLYLLLDASGNDITGGDPVSYRDLVDIILESEVSDDLDQRWADGGRNWRGNDEEEKQFRREFATEEAEECGYRIIEVLK